MKLPRALFVIVCTTGLCSCATVVPEPTLATMLRASQRWPGTTLRDLNEGRAVYVRKCSGCHSLHTPDEFTPREWESKVPEMMVRAKLTPTEANLVIRYLASSSEIARNEPQ